MNRPITNMRILFMGTAPFAVPSLESLLAAGHEVVGVVTQPDKPVGRKRELLPSAVKSAALGHGLPVYQPVRLRKDKALHETVRGLAPDIVAYAAYGQIIPQAFLDIPRLGCWNVHGSLLPAYRGAAPIQWSIINGDPRTGVCVMIAEAGLDTGPVLAAAEMDILPVDNAFTLGERMAAVGARLLVDTIAGWERGEVAPKPQDPRLATLAPAIEKEDARIDWLRPATALDCFVRGMNPKPGAWTLWRGGEFKVWAAASASEAPGAPGAVGIAGKRVLVGTGGGALELLTVQPSGKRPMPALDWARGFRSAEAFGV
ncbi:MAG TPA: methionyl-tRNA formyltransferase [Armatimonadota bacterium]|jgi:methionyl-tRNA formyltransferase